MIIGGVLALITSWTAIFFGINHSILQAIMFGAGFLIVSGTGPVFRNAIYFRNDEDVGFKKSWPFLLLAIGILPIGYWLGKHVPEINFIPFKIDGGLWCILAGPLTGLFFDNSLSNEINIRRKHFDSTQP